MWAKANRDHTGQGGALDRLQYSSKFRSAPLPGCAKSFICWCSGSKRLFSRWVPETPNLSHNQSSRIESFLEFPQIWENLYFVLNSSLKTEEKQMGENPYSEFTRKSFSLQWYIVTHEEFNKDSNKLVQNSEGGKEEMKLTLDPLGPTICVPLIPSLSQSKLVKACVFFSLHSLV